MVDYCSVCGGSLVNTKRTLECEDCGHVEKKL